MDHFHTGCSLQPELSATSYKQETMKATLISYKKLTSVKAFILSWGFCLNFSSTVICWVGDKGFLWRWSEISEHIWNANWKQWKFQSSANFPFKNSKTFQCKNRRGQGKNTDPLKKIIYTLRLVDRLVDWVYQHQGMACILNKSTLHQDVCGNIQTQ